MFKEPIYQSCNKSHGEYCLREWVDPATIPDWDNIDVCDSEIKDTAAVCVYGGCPGGWWSGLSQDRREIS